ncbi:MAG: hypothetical protein ACOX1O_03710 [Eggerthellaceae bacterium]|jgi:hypothetical protein
MGVSIFKRRLSLVAAALGAAIALVFAMGVLAPAGSAAVPTAQAQTTKVALVYNGPNYVVNYLNKHKYPTVKTAAISKGKLVLKKGKYGNVKANGKVGSMKKAKSFKLAKNCKFYKASKKSGGFLTKHISKKAFNKALKSLSKKHGNTKPKSLGAVSFITNSKGKVTRALYYKQNI